MNSKHEKCDLCGSLNIHKIFTKVNFHVVGGTEKFGTHGYSGKHLDLVKRLKGDKKYRDGYRKEREEQEKIGLSRWKAEQEMSQSKEIFQKMKEEGMKMTPQEKQKIKDEFGIKKGMKTGKLKF